jgi:acetylornithine deacetylase/succinyl-diaminopimelate desuccinylase-like protein
LWSTTSLRGVIVGTLEVSLLTEGVHSGDGSGVVASSFRVLRQLLARLEAADSGRIELEALNVPIPAQRVEQAARAAAALGAEVWQKFPLQPGVKPVSSDNTELILNRTWRPALAVTGAEGLPLPANAGNVLRPLTRLKLSLRVPPHADAARATAAVKAALEKDPPYGARVRFEGGAPSNGWDAPPLEPWLEAALEQASLRRFGKPAMYLGEGGTIPFMSMLGERFPSAQFCITGVLGPGSNAHGPNEFLHLPTARRLTLCVADVLAAHAVRETPMR